VALYLLITMVPFALLAPVVGPLLDHFRHGRRYALAATMLGRAFLAYVISDNLFGWGLYPAAFGVLALSRSYGVARSAAVPRLLPQGIGLSQAGARASVYGTFAGAVVAPIGLLAFKFGPQWPLRVAAIIFVAGMVISLRLPPRADSEPPEAVPRPWRAMLRLGRGEDRPLAGKLVIATLIGSASLRLLYGFLLLFLAFVIMANQLDTTLLGQDIGRQGAVGLVGGALVIGTFLSTAVGTRLRIRRPLALQSAGLTITAGVAVLAAIFYNLAMVTLLALITAIFSGIAKLAIDASIQERVPERLRASAFAHSETVLMIAWVIGGGIGLIPLTGRLGVALAALLAVAAAGRAGYVAARLHNEQLSGRAGDPDEAVGDAARNDAAQDDAVRDDEAVRDGDAVRAGHRAGAEPTDPWPDAPTVPTRSRPNPAPRTRSGGSRPGSRDDQDDSTPGKAGRRPGDPGRPAESRRTDPTRIDSTRVDNRRADQKWADQTRANHDRPDPTRVEPPVTRKRWFGARKGAADQPVTGPAKREPNPPEPTPAETRPTPSRPPEDRSPEGRPDPALAPPGFHVYRPSSAERAAGNGDDPGDRAGRGEDDDRR
jgi:hypothetical protein